MTTSTPNSEPKGLAAALQRVTSAKLSDDVKDNVKVLTLDIETSPNMAYVWGLWQQNVSLNQLMERGQVICWAAKWYHEGEPIFMSDHHDGHAAMIHGIWRLLDQADIVVTYNGVSFDLPHLRREFALLGLAPPAPWKDVDLLRVVKKQFRFPSNKLDNVVQELNLGAKVSTGGFELWTGCMAGDPESWETMRRYNIGDIKVTEALYDRLRPWIPNHPHLGMWLEVDDSGETWACPNCGSTKLDHLTEDRVRTNVQSYRAYRCPECKHYIRGTQRLKDPTRTRSAR